MTKRRINVRAVVVRDNTILAVKHRLSDGSEAEYWALPGGGLDPFEDLSTGVMREMKEELGVEASVGKLLFVQQFHSRREDFDEELEFHFQVHDADIYDALDFMSTTHGADELVRVEFVDPKEVKILPRFLSEVDVAAYATGERTPYIHTEL